MFKRIKNDVQEGEQLEDVPPEPTGFNHLPYDCFHLIFRLLTLSQVINLRRVCSIWNGHVQHLCHEKHSLKLILYTQIKIPRHGRNGPRWVCPKMFPEQPREMDLYYTDDVTQLLEDNRSADQNNRHDYVNIEMFRLTVRNIAGLTQLFRSLTNLTIVFNCKNQITNVNRLERLIRALSCPNLVHFSIWITKYTEKKELNYGDTELLERLHQIVSQQASHSLATVRQLHLCYGIGGLNFLPDRKDPQLELPQHFLSNLEKISLDCYSDKILNEVLCKLGSNLTDLSIDLRLIVEGLDGWAEELEKSPISKSVTHLRLFLEDEEQFQVFAQVFKVVKNLQIGCTERLSLTPSWITTLSTLPHLSTLRLHRFELDHPLETTSKLLQPTIQSLPSVKHLTMFKNLNINETAYGRHVPYFDEDEARTYWNRYCKTLSGHFPQVELLTIVSERHEDEADGLNQLLESKYYFVQLKKHFTEFRKFKLM